ncbi:MAG: hypothetical protein Q8O67_11475 [Deltaproteobacteria bacterium]|nr:hypothetical protein [Deltaproteobacteria bacterium]
MSRLVVVAVALAALAGCPGGQTKPDDKGLAHATPPIVGGWSSACFPLSYEDGTEGFAQLVFDMTPTAWALDYTMFDDAACTSRLGTIHVDGPWVVERPSATLPGAFEARFDFGTRTVTPHVDGFIAFLQSMACGKSPYAVGAAQDILASGCPTLGFQPTATCRSDYDLVFVNGGTLQFGARPKDNNMCTPDKRPTALGAPLAKVR